MKTSLDETMTETRTVPRDESAPGGDGTVVRPASTEDRAPGCSPRTPTGKLALFMGGGGARAAYQVGFLRHLARRHPDLEVPVLVGVSAGAINAALLASHHGIFAQAVEELAELWRNLTVDRVFRVDFPSLAGHVSRWGLHLLSGGLVSRRQLRGLVDTSPLRRLLSEALHAVDGELTGIRANLTRRCLQAVALTTSSYTTGQAVTWVQGSGFRPWTRPQRQAREAVLTADHVMASSALPLFFPAVRIEDHYHGDGGIRQRAPLSPALHLGADRIMDQGEADAEARCEEIEAFLSGEGRELTAARKDH